jgi:thiamine biosynthesis lipoprotein
VILKSILIWSLAALPAWAGVEMPAPVAASREYVMGTFAEVRVYDGDEAGSRRAVEAALAEIRALDRVLAVQRPDSDVSRLNREASRGPVRVDPRVVEVLTRSVAVSHATEGAFDVTVLPVVRAWGFIDGHPHPPASGPTPRIAGWRSLRIDAAAGTVAFADAAAQVDLGGIGKGYALDRARDVLRGQGVRSAWLDLGGNIATLGAPPGGGPWRIAVRHPRRDGDRLGVVAMGEASVSTSSDAQQYAMEDGNRRGHIIDPRSGRPADALVSATVVAASATTADALSTASIVLGEARAREILANAGAEGLLVAPAPGGSLRLSATAGLDFHTDGAVVAATSEMGRQR